MRQEDAAELLQMHVLREEASPTLGHLTISLGQSILTCAHCRQSREPTVEIFRTFEVPIEISGPEVEAPVRFTDVQSAFNAFLTEEPVELRDLCSRCQQNKWTKALRVVALPQVLVLTLKRFKNVKLETGRYAERCVQHLVTPTEVLDFQGHLYDLRSFIVHFGESIQSGHYIALAKHETDTGTWWLYNDNERREATREQVATNASFRRYGQMKSYVLFYEKRPTAQ